MSNKEELNIYSKIILDYMYENTNLITAYHSTLKYKGYDKRVYNLIKKTFKSPIVKDSKIDIVTNKYLLKEFVSLILFYDKKNILVSKRVDNTDEVILIAANTKLLYDKIIESVKNNMVECFIRNIHEVINWINNHDNKDICYYEVNYNEIWNYFKDE